MKTRRTPHGVFQAFLRAIECPNASREILRLDADCPLELTISAIGRMKRSARSYYVHPRGLWHHAVETLKQLETVTDTLRTIFPRCHEQISRHTTGMIAGVPRAVILKTAALLHDAAKPGCARRQNGKIRFIGHEEKGAQVIRKIFRLRGFPAEAADALAVLIRHHMRIISLSEAPEITDRAARRLFTDVGSLVPELLILSLADWRSYRRLPGFKIAVYRAQEQAVRELMRRFFLPPVPRAPTPLLNGHAIMEHLHITPGPLVGVILKKIARARSLGKASNRAQAMAIARACLKTAK